jgi:hypothetical protein
MIYNAMLSIWGNSVKPDNMAMIWIANTLHFCGILWVANIFGTISSIFSTHNIRDVKTDARMELVNSNMRYLKLPELIQKDIREFMNLTSNS